MNTNTLATLKTLPAALIVWLGSALFIPNATAEQATDKPLAKERWLQVELQASVEAIDYELREVVLKDRSGKQVTATANQQVKRFDEIKVGDTVKTQYWSFIRAEFRHPTAAEKAVPLVVLFEAGKAPKEIDPSGAVGAIVKAVVEVVGLDLEAKRVAIQGPRGNFVILPVLDDAVLNNLSLGEVAVMTYAQASVTSLIKIQ